MFYYSLLPFIYSFTLYVFMSKLVWLRAWDTVRERGIKKRGAPLPPLAYDHKKSLSIEAREKAG